MRFLLSQVAVAALLATSAAAGSLPGGQLAAATIGAPSSKAPPTSDGSSGSFNGQFGGGGCLVWLNTDTGQVWCSDSGGFVLFTVPYKVVKWKKQTFNAYNFTDMTVQPSVKLTIYGTHPAMFLANQDITFSGQFTIAANHGSGGVAATSETQDLKGGDGTSPAGVAGGGGGYGPSGSVTSGGCVEYYTSAGGGGGGSTLHTGKDGRHGDFPWDAGNPIHNVPGDGGAVEPSTLYGGSGGGAGGASSYAGNFYAFPGADGGGAVVISTTGSIEITSTGVIDASGHDGIVAAYNTGSSGGGGAGNEWFYATGNFSNSGVLNLHGGAGGKSKYSSGCAKTKTIEGPDGGDGAGGHLRVNAGTFDNAGLIDVSGGADDPGRSGAVTVEGRVVHRGWIKGLSEGAAMP
jgi:hypothetical protein